MNGDDDDFFVIQAMRLHAELSVVQFQLIIAESESDEKDDVELDLEDELLRVAGPEKRSPATGFKAAYIRTPGKKDNAGSP